MLTLVFASVVLIVTTMPGWSRPDPGGWFLIILVGVFLSALDIQTVARRGIAAAMRFKAVDEA